MVKGSGLMENTILQYDLSILDSENHITFELYGS